MSDEPSRRRKTTRKLPIPRDAPSDKSGEPTARRRLLQDPAPSAQPVLVKASEISSRRQRFLWDKRIPTGAVTLFAGRGGVGKSTFAIWLAVEAQHGRLEGDLRGEPATVLWISVEDHWETQMKPRLQAAGADMDRIYKVAIRHEVDRETGERVPQLPEDAPAILDAIETTGAKLIVLDPITSTIAGDDHKRDVVRRVLDPLAKIAGETDAVVLGIMHFNKGGGVASDKLSGSHAYRDAARAVMVFALDDETGHVVMTQDKGNYADFGDMSIAYRLLDTPVELDDGEVAHVAKVHMIGETSMSVGQIINRVPASDEVVQWITDYMLSSGGPVPAKEAEADGREAGYSRDQLKRARKRCRPRIESKKVGMPGLWMWQFAEESAKNAVPPESALLPESASAQRTLQEPK